MPITEGLPYLPAFVAAVEAGTFSEAAKRLAITQSAVSKQIQALERSVGATLFDRLPRQLVLTEAGESLATVARVLLGELAAFSETLAAQQDGEPRGELRIGTTETLGSYRLPSWLRQLADRFPGIRPALQVGSAARILQELQTGRLDLAIVIGGDYPDVLEAQVLRGDPLYVVGTPALAAQVPARTPLTDLLLPFVLPDREDPWRQHLESQIFAPLAWRPLVSWVLNPIEAIKGFVREGLGLTILPAHAIHEDLHAGLLTMVPVSTVLVGQTIDLVRHRHRRASRVVDAAWLALANVARNERG